VGNGLLQDRLPKSASTLHRLLGWRLNSVYFWHDANNPLPVDLVVVDEASMVSLTLMAKLFDALPEKASVILHGDRDQLRPSSPERSSAI
jgi:exodeoxyribonuclease V alpha subunit